MKKLALVLVLGAAVAFSPASAQADTIAVGDSVVISDVASGPYSGSASGGGTFWVHNVTQVGPDFMTFCMELNEFISFGPQFLVSSIEDYAVKGGADFDGPPNDGTDYLSAETKALYDYFRSSAPAFSGGDLQNAFWYFEHEITTSQAANPAYVWAVANAATYQLAGEVKALNLQFKSATRVGEDAQSLLTWRRLTVPDGGATLMLLGGALLGLGALRRKFRQ